MTTTQNTNPNKATTIRVISNGVTAEYVGKTVESIIRREYGKKAAFLISQDRNSPEWGQIVTPATGGGWNVQGRVLGVESTGPDGGHELATDY
jgi:hypothetical protein